LEELAIFEHTYCHNLEDQKRNYYNSYNLTDSLLKTAKFH